MLYTPYDASMNIKHTSVDDEGNKCTLSMESTSGEDGRLAFTCTYLKESEHIELGVSDIPVIIEMLKAAHKFYKDQGLLGGD